MGIPKEPVGNPYDSRSFQQKSSGQSDKIEYIGACVPVPPSRLEAKASRLEPKSLLA